jgi:shikimate dehydrogenase
MSQLTPDLYCVMGNPIEHSRSPDIHHTFATESQQLINYQKKLVALDGFSNAVNTFVEEGGKGANITVPFKEKALEIADVLTERASLAGAVNTLTFKEGKIYGDNTDGEGLVQDLLTNKVALKQSRVLLLGAGGAARGVLLPLLAQNPQSIVIANRTLSKAEIMCQQFSDERISASTYHDLANLNFDIIINATSASLAGDLPPIPPSIIDSEVVCYDMVYGKNRTPFLLWANEYGAQHLLDGLGMLVGQAAVSFAIWRGVSPRVQPVIEKIRTALNEE